MPRNITVSFVDGTSHVYSGVPDNVTPGQVTARAAKEFSGKQIANLDGGRPTPMTQPPTPRSPAPVPVTTRAQEIQAIAKKHVDQQEKLNVLPGAVGRFDNAMSAGMSRMMLGIPERIGAAMNYYTNNPNKSKSYSDELDVQRAITDETQRRNPAGSIVGSLAGGVASGTAEAALVKAAGARLAASAAPIAARVGNVLQGLTSLKKGQLATNAAKVAIGGAGGGAAQAAGEGSNIEQGAKSGAVGALALGAGAKVLGASAKAVRGLRRPFSQDVGAALKEVVREDPAALAARQGDLSARTGTSVPVVAALKDQDFQRVTNKVLKNSPDATEIAKGKTGDYIRGFMDRMLGHVNAAGAAGDAQTVQGIGDLAALRKDTADTLMAPVADGNVDLTQIPFDDVERQMTRGVGGRIAGIGPKISAALRDLPPDGLTGESVSGQDLVNARNLMNQYGLGGGPVNISVRDADNLRLTLDAAGKASMTSNPANSMALRNASKAIGAHVGENFPEYRQMLDTYGAHSRMMEGFDTASKGQRVADVADDQMRANLTSPEGRVGMKAGELYRLRSAASAKPTSAISLARDLASEGNLTRPASAAPDAANPGTVTENIGDAPAAGLADASQAETQVLGRMTDTEKLNSMAKDEDGALSPGDLAAAIPGHAYAKMNVARKILNLLPNGFNPKVATNMAEMLYSGDAGQATQVFNALGKVGVGQDAVKGIMADALPVTAAAGAANADRQNEAPPLPPPADASDAEIPQLDPGAPQAEPGAAPPEMDAAGAAAPAAAPPAPPELDDIPHLQDDPHDGEPSAQPISFDPNRPYGRQVIESLFPDAKITSDVRDPNDKLSQENPRSYHTRSQNAVDVEPIPGMSFGGFIQHLRDNGYQIVEAIDEVNHPSKYATGKHWHVVVA